VVEIAVFAPNLDKLWQVKFMGQIVAKKNEILGKKH